MILTMTLIVIQMPKTTMILDDDNNNVQLS